MRARLPEFQSIVQVYAVIAVMFAGWTIIAFLWKLSGWLLLLNLGEIFIVFAYAMVTNFIESLTILTMLLAGCVVLPASSLRDDFVVRGTILSIGLIGSLMVFVGSQMQFGVERGFLLLIAPLLVLLGMAWVLQRASQFQGVRSLVIGFSDRVVIFLLILAPVFLVTSAYVIFRNVS
ncbi:MAG TPA: hypothetical protein VFG81_18470 [Anaerolineales bacterium]|jgi:hypothetical protein|nr:hypothetical protein [Anaerolineales bacterium]